MKHLTDVEHAFVPFDDAMQFQHLLSPEKHKVTIPQLVNILRPGMNMFTNINGAAVFNYSACMESSLLLDGGFTYEDMLAVIDANVYIHESYHTLKHDDTGYRPPLDVIWPSHAVLADKKYIGVVKTTDYAKDSVGVKITRRIEHTIWNDRTVPNHLVIITLQDNSVVQLSRSRILGCLKPNGDDPAGLYADPFVGDAACLFERMVPEDLAVTLVLNPA